MGLNITGIKLAEMAAEGVENNPIVTAYDFVSTATITSDRTALTDGDLANLQDPGTFSFWTPDTSSQTTATLTLELDAVREVNFLGLVAHTLTDVSIALEYSIDTGTTWLPIDTVTQADESNFGLYFEDTSADYFRVVLTFADSTSISIGAVALSYLLTMPTCIYQGYTPPLQATEVTLQSNVTEGGNFVGVSVVRQGQSGSFDLEYLPDTFVRGAAFSAFQDRFNSGLPVFWAWRPYKYSDLKYAWRSGNPIVPMNSGPLALMSFSASFRAYNDCALEGIPVSTIALPPPSEPEAPGAAVDEDVETWRLMITQSNATDICTIGEIEFLTAVDGADITSPSTVSISDRASVGSSGFSSVVEDLFDDNQTTFWAGATGAIAAGTSTVSWQFSEPTLVSGARIKARATVNGDQTPLGFDLQTSNNGTAWTTILQVTGEAGYAGGEVREFIGANTTAANWARIVFTEAGTYDGGALSGLDFINEASGIDLMKNDLRKTNRISSGGYHLDSLRPELAFDDQFATSGNWASQDEPVANGNSWIAYDFDTAQSITGVRLMSGEFGSQMPTGFTIQRQQLGSDVWEDMIVVTGEPGWSNYQTRSFYES